MGYFASPGVAKVSPLISMFVAAGLTVAFYVWRGRALARPRTNAAILACLYCLTLGIALRFGGRTYPGIYFPDSRFLNSLLNGNGLFTGIGYMAVVAAWSAEVARLLLRPSILGVDLALRMLKWAGVGLAVIIAIYGFVWAFNMQRLA